MRTIRLEQALNESGLNRPRSMKILPPPQGLDWQLVVETTGGEEVCILHDNLTQLTTFSSKILTALAQ